MIGLVKLFKQKKCRTCKEKFEPSRPLQECCSVVCAIEYAKNKRASKERKERKELKERIKSRRDWQKEAQAAFNSFVRARDKDMPCISCGRYHAGSYDAGHYRTAGGNPELRFNEDNCHRQCVPCNQHLHGNIVNYRIGLIERIGPERVEVIEGKHEAKHYSIEQLQEIKATYSRKARELLKDDENRTNRRLHRAADRAQGACRPHREAPDGFQGRTRRNQACRATDLEAQRQLTQTIQGGMMSLDDDATAREEMDRDLALQIRRPILPLTGN